jgi:AMMECR1 domain-containing protein
LRHSWLIFLFEATVERILAHLNQGKDVRKGDWNNKEVNIHSLFIFVTIKSCKLDNPALRGGSNAPIYP